MTVTKIIMRLLEGIVGLFFFHGGLYCSKLGGEYGTGYGGFCYIIGIILVIHSGYYFISNLRKKK